MSIPPPSTVFTASPAWHWLIVFYFFLGGIAGGAYFLAALIDLVGDPLDRPLARVGYLLAFPLTVVCGLLLTLDLGRPLRFWHMLVQSETLRPMFKGWSPMSLGSWALLLFGAFSAVSFVGALVEGRDGRRAGLARVRPPGVLGGIFTVLGGALGFFLAGYTGVLLAATNRPIWADTTLLGLVFVVSAASTAAATLGLVARFRAATRPAGLHALERFDSIMLVLELIALVALVVSLGGLARVWLSAWGLLLVVGVVLAGIVLPLLLYVCPSWRWAALAPALVLLGGFLLRVVLVFSSEAV
jgi:formate-dependent nitrite reductase membrane component NrfD